MAKSMSKDSQIILNMMRVQDNMKEVLGDEANQSEVAMDAKKVDVLTFYIVKLFALRKNFSGKTKKALTMFNDFKGATVLKSMSVCYPTVSALEIVRMAHSLSDELARAELIERYDLCIKESEKYSE